MKKYFQSTSRSAPLITAMKWCVVLTVYIILSVTEAYAQEQSLARKWNEVLLESIREDYARPTVHARNLFAVSAAMYESWAAYHEEASPYLLGTEIRGFYTPFSGIPEPSDKQKAIEEALSYSVYRVLKHRFQFSPHKASTLARIDSLFSAIGYDQSFTSTDYESGNPAALGNYIGTQIIEFGLQDGSNEANRYDNLYYEPVNEPLKPHLPGNSTLTNPNRWQPLTLEEFIDQSGNPTSSSTPPFLSPEWGNVAPFAMTDEALTINKREEHEYRVYHDPGAPPYIDMENDPGSSELYKSFFSMVSIWASHLDPTDGVMIDISPASMGNVQTLPTDFKAYDQFYNRLQGGDPGIGRSQNPATGQPYAEQWVPRGDYTRVLAEFWADGPDSETPPGHWFTILNYVNDQQALEKRFKGEGPVLDALEWDVKAYFTLAGAMHDVAIASWSVKGWYDYIRPISAIRWMADQGQSSDPEAMNYSENGIPLEEGYIELVQEGDPLAGFSNKNVGKIKLYTWRGHTYIQDPEMDQAGVGWILADNWWPYQRPSFVTPPFAGYISGHSTFSRAAAEVLTAFTGTPYFPGGMGEFVAKKNDFLVFEQGPSVDVVLQWATYRDASDQCSLSRIWGGIHPPADDINGRLMGIEIGQNAFAKAEAYFKGKVKPVLKAQEPLTANPVQVYPVPTKIGDELTVTTKSEDAIQSVFLFNSQGMLLNTIDGSEKNPASLSIATQEYTPGVYILSIVTKKSKSTRRIILL